MSLKLINIFDKINFKKIFSTMSTADLLTQKLTSENEDAVNNSEEEEEV